LIRCVRVCVCVCVCERERERERERRKFPVIQKYFRIFPGFPRTSLRERIFRLEIREEKIKFIGLVLGKGNGKIMVLNLKWCSQVLFKTWFIYVYRSCKIA
jgi:hypothetical protein